LSVELLRAYWKCPQLQRYATRGQEQHGVDFIDLSGEEPLRGGQCKLHEEGKSITPSEIRGEVEKAEEFKPKLGVYAILTTAKAKKLAHDAVLQINKEHREKELFQVQLLDWARIEELLDQYPTIRDQFYSGGLSPIVQVATRIEYK